MQNVASKMGFRVHQRNIGTKYLKVLVLSSVPELCGCSVCQIAVRRAALISAQLLTVSAHMLWDFLDFLSFGATVAKRIFLAVWL